MPSALVTVTVMRSDSLVKTKVVGHVRRRALRGCVDQTWMYLQYEGATPGKAVFGCLQACILLILCAPRLHTHTHTRTYTLTQTHTRYASGRLQACHLLLYLTPIRKCEVRRWCLQACHVQGSQCDPVGKDSARDLVRNLLLYYTPITEGEVQRCRSVREDHQEEISGSYVFTRAERRTHSLSFTQTILVRACVDARNNARMRARTRAHTDFRKNKASLPRAHARVGAHAHNFRWKIENSKDAAYLGFETFQTLTPS